MIVYYHVGSSSAQTHTVTLRKRQKLQNSEIIDWIVYIQHILTV